MATLEIASINYLHQTDGYEFSVSARDPEGQELGFALSYLVNLLPEEAHISFPGQNDFVWVEPGFRNRGIGTSMLKITGRIVRNFYAVANVTAFAVTSKQSLAYYEKAFSASRVPGSGVHGSLIQIKFPL